MAKALNDVAAGLWLPSQFLTGGDKENHNNGANADLDAAFGFPSEFPYEFDSFGGSSSSSSSSPSALGSPVESVAGSTETEGTNDVDEDFFAALTRRLSQSTLYETPKLTVPTCCVRDKSESQKTWALARSPQSTLSGIGSWSGRSSGSGDGSPNIASQVPSPPTTPFPAKNDVAWDVIYAAAGQVARMKMNGEATKYDLQNDAFLAPPRASAPKNPTPSLYSNQSFIQVQPQQVMKQQCASVWGRQAKADWLAYQQQKMQNGTGRNVGYESSVKCGRHVSVSQSAWPPLQVHPQHNHQHVPLHNGSGTRAAVHGGSGARRGCGGTGVFLPRQYGNPQDSRKKTNCAPVLLPSKVVHALNLKIDDFNAAASQTALSGAFATHYDALVARRNALLLQQQRLSVRAEEAVNHELRLPQEWIY